MIAKILYVQKEGGETIGREMGFNKGLYTFDSHLGPTGLDLSSKWRSHANHVDP